PHLTTNEKRKYMGMYYFMIATLLFVSGCFFRLVMLSWKERPIALTLVLFAVSLGLFLEGINLFIVGIYTLVYEHQQQQLKESSKCNGSSSIIMNEPWIKRRFYKKLAEFIRDRFIGRVIKDIRESAQLSSSTTAADRNRLAD
ncbi:unnamed protein product, partial [Rotaria magnacalcarata]